MRSNVRCLLTSVIGGGLWLTGCWLLTSGEALAESKVAGRGDSSPIKVFNPRLLPGGDIPAVRTPLGIANDYKPWVVRLDGQALLMVAFCYGPLPGATGADQDAYWERAVFWRSSDGGHSWGPRQERPDVPGREFSLNRLADGTLIMLCHLLSRDATNRAGHSYSKVFRSTDDGRTWSETRIGPEGFPPNPQTASDWTVVEVPDEDRPGKVMTMLGVSVQHGGKLAPAHVFLWRSRDSGRTWDKSLNPDTRGWIDVDGFFSQSTTYRCASGRLLHPVRVDRTGPHWKLPGARNFEQEAGDQGDRMMLWESIDNGRSWRRHRGHGTFGTYGEMYPRFLRLRDGRLLLTFTVRSNSTTDGHALGLRAIISHDDGRSWDFTRDRLVIDAKNQGASGGGFGNTIQMDDGGLVSCYSYRGGDAKAHIEAIRWRLPWPK